MKRKPPKSVTQRRRIVLPEDDEFEDMPQYQPEYKQAWRQCKFEEEREELESQLEGRKHVPSSAFGSIWLAIKEVEQARTNLNKAQARLETKVAKAPKEIANRYRQFLLAGGATSDQWFDWDKKPKQVVPQKRGLRLVVNRKIVRYRLVEKDDGPKAA
jgi:hypothetical protein